MIERPRHHLMACVEADGRAGRLVGSAQHLAQALGCGWTVAVLDTPADPPTGDTRTRGAEPTAAATATAAITPTPTPTPTQTQTRTQTQASTSTPEPPSTLTTCSELDAALQAARQAGAATCRVPVSTRRTRALVEAVAARVLTERSTILVIGRPKAGRAQGGRRLQGPFEHRLSQALPGVAVHVIDDSSPLAAADSLPSSGAFHGGWAAVAVLALCTVFSALLRRHLEPANLIMVYLAGVVWVSFRAARPVAVLSVVASVLLYDGLFIARGGGAQPSQPHVLLVSAALLLVGLSISHLATRSRTQTATAEARAQRAQALNRLTLELVKARSRSSIGTALALTVHGTLGASAQLLAADDATGAPPAGGSLEPQSRLARLAVDLRTETGAGTAIEPAQRVRCLPLLTASGVVGVVAVDLLARRHDSAEDRQLLKAFANQAAVALERAVFESRSAHSAVEAERERLRNTLLTSISHDFRTPLTTIVGVATSLIEQADAIDAGHRDVLLRSLLAEARRLHAMTSNLLDLARLQEGAIRPNLEWCPVDELLQEARTALAARLQGHRVTVSVGSDSVVWCDPRLIGQLLVNLLDNAVRHAPGADIHIASELSQGAWSLAVKDGGPGVPAGLENEVFKKFFQGRADATGTGLGLAICTAVAELHGGTLTVGAGPGACFVLSLPQPQAPPGGLEVAE